MRLEKKTRITLAVGIFALALLIRLIGIGWGLQNEFHNPSYHPDEAVIFNSSQRIEPAQFKFTPGFYNYGTLYLTALRVATDMTSAYTGAPDEKSDDSYWAWVSRADFSGRLLSAIAGALTAVFLFFLVYRFAGAIGGIAAALVIAVAPGHVMHSRFQTPDVFALMLLTASALCALKLLPGFAESDSGKDEAVEVSPDPEGGEGSPVAPLSAEPANPLKWTLLAGALAGLSAGTKYTGILGLLILAVALWYTRRNLVAAATHFALGLIAAIVAFVLSTPGVLLENSAFMRDFTYEMGHTASGHGLAFVDTSNGFIYHLANLFLGLGLLITTIGVVGLVWAAVKKHPWAIALLAFALLYYVVIGRAEVKFLRYTFPLYPGIAAGFGWLIAETQKTNWRRAGMILAILAIGGVDTGGLVGASKVTAWMASPDPRDQAIAWLRSHATDTTSVGYAVDPWYWSVPLFKNAPVPRFPMGPDYIRAFRATGNPFLARVAMMDETAQPKTVFPFDPGPPVQYPAFNMALLQNIKPEFIPVTTFEAGYQDRLVGATDLEGADATMVRQYRDFIEQLREDYEPVASFGSPSPLVEDYHYVQPQVLIWKRKTSP